MRIYTRTGDHGETSLAGGERTDKDDIRVEAYGTIDELNALLGVTRTHASGGHLDALLAGLQSDLFLVGSELASPPGREVPDKLSEVRLGALEEEIDRMQERLAPLRHFILPGGSRGAALLHLARSVARRAERRVVSLSRTSTVRPTVLSYLNRLSDLLFVMARWENQAADAPEEQWTPPAGRGAE